MAVAEAPTVDVEELIAYWDYFEPEQQAELLTYVTSYEAFKIRYWDDPVGFILECVEWPDTDQPAPYQLDIAQLLYDEARVAVRGPHGLGKTALAAWIILWFALTREGKDWKIPTTASNWRQLTKYLWPEVHKWARRLKWDVIGREEFNLRHELMGLSIKLSTGQAFPLASDKPENLEGAHADHLLYLFDEAKIIPDGTFDSAEGALSTQGLDDTKEIFVLAISTPGEPNGRFYDIHSRKPGFEDWNVRHVTRDEAIAAGRLSLAWCEQRKKQWGEESAVYQNRVMGEFASSEEDTVIPLHWIEAANQRWLEWADSGKNYVRFTGVGVDVGGGGETGDKTVFAMCYDGIKFDTLRKYARGDPEVATMRTAGRTKGILDASRTGYACVDGIGIGAGVVHRLNEQGYGKRVKSFIASAGTKAKELSGEMGFTNLRSAAWWNMREMLDPNNGHDVCLPPDDDLLGELVAPKWTETSGARIKIESKAEIKKRLNRSTDCADAVIQIAGHHLVKKRTGRVYHGSV
jgi:hypothetical protein